MKKLFAFLLLLSLAGAEFILESIDVSVNDIQPDGSAAVRENIKFLVKGNYSKALYDSGLKTTDDLSFWTSNTGISEIRQHVNPAVVLIGNFRLQPQPRSGCNPFLDTCHGGLVISYTVRPVYGNSGLTNGTGLFFLDDYKPRTTRYTLNPAALSFTPTEGGNLLIASNVKFSVKMPQGSSVMEIDPEPSESFDSPQGKTLSWTDMVLVRFSLVFDVESSLGKEASDFFSDTILRFQDTASSSYGISFLIMLGILLGSYVYINVAKKKREENVQR